MYPISDCEIEEDHNLYYYAEVYKSNFISKRFKILFYIDFD